MYKWGFFILLGINVYTFGSQFLSKGSVNERVNEMVLIKAKPEHTELNIIQKFRPVRSASRTIEKRVSAPVDLTMELEEKAKNSLLARVVEDLKGQYLFFFKFNDLSPEKLRKVELILAERQSTRGSCYGENFTEDELIKKLEKAGLDFDEIQQVSDFLDKEWTYYALMNFGIEPSKVRGSYIDLVDEIYYFSQSLQNDDSKKIVSMVDLDPFADSDPFSDSDPFAESELELQVEIREGILKIINELNKESLEVYDRQIEILSKYIDVPDNIKLKILRNLASN